MHGAIKLVFNAALKSIYSPIVRPFGQLRPEEMIVSRFEPSREVLWIEGCRPQSVQYMEL